MHARDLMKKKVQKRRSSGRPTREMSAEMDVRLLDTARVLFARNGYANATVDEVAVMLGASKHTIYRRFSGKEELFEAVVERDIERFREQLLATTDLERPLHSLYGCARRYFNFGTDETYAALYLFITAEAAISMEMRTKLERWAASALEPLQAAVERAQICGVLVSSGATNACAVLVDLLDGAADRVRLSGHPGRRPEIVEAVFEERWKLFLRLFSSYQ